MPADITGTTVLATGPDGRALASRFEPGPIFTNLLLADEINRAGPKTQSALLQAMQEREVTPLRAALPAAATRSSSSRRRTRSSWPGTYPLPEAQLDRFLFKVVVPQPDGGGPDRRSPSAPRGPSAAPRRGARRGGDRRASARLVRRIPVAAPVLRGVTRGGARDPARPPRQPGRGAPLRAPRRLAARPAGAAARREGPRLPRGALQREHRGRAPLLAARRCATG